MLQERAQRSDGNGPVWWLRRVQEVAHDPSRGHTSSEPEAPFERPGKMSLSSPERVEILRFVEVVKDPGAANGSPSLGR